MRASHPLGLATEIAFNLFRILGTSYLLELSLEFSTSDGRRNVVWLVADCFVERIGQVSDIGVMDSPKDLES